MTMRLNSIRAHTMLVLLVLCILIVLVFGGIELYNAHQGIKNDTAMNNLQDSRYMANYVHMYLHNITSGVNVVSMSPDTVRAIDTRDISHLKEIADNLDNYVTETDFVIFIDDRGNLLYSTHKINITVYNSYSWYGEALKSNKSYLTGIYYSDDLNNYALALIEPIQENNTIIGRTMILIQPQRLKDDIQSQIISPNEDIMIVDHEGMLISNDKDIPIELYTNVSSFSAVRHLLNGEEGIIEENNTWDNQSRISAYYPDPELGWGVIVSTPKSSIYQSLGREVAIMSGVLAIFVIALLVVGFFVSNYITAPIIRLSRTMQKISEGQNTARASIKRTDEIGEMAQNFNAMMDKLELAEKARTDAKEEAELYVDLLSHDINNMNQVALGYIDLTLDSLKQKECDLSLLEKTRAMLYNSSDLIDNVKKIQKIKAGVIKPEVIDIGTLIRETIDKYKQVRGRDVTINYHDTGECKLLASELLGDVFSNLIVNAIKHSSGPLTIDVGLTKAQENGIEYCVVTVSDDGPGIPDDKKKILFNRFMRGATKAEGTGLGLYIVRSLVESFKGRVRVEDRIAGDHTKGVRFTVLLPAIDH